MPRQTFVPGRQYAASLLPKGLLELPDGPALDSIWIEPPNIEQSPSLVVQTALLFETELSLGIPGVDAVRLVVAPEGNATTFMFRFAVEPTPRLSVVDVPLALRFRPDLLAPARRVAGQAEQWEVNPDVAALDVTLAKVTLGVSFDGAVTMQTNVSIDLPPAMIGKTGVVIEAKGLGLFLDGEAPPPGKPAGWRGVHIARAALHLPGELAGIVGTLAVTDAYIGNGGFSGSVSDDWTPPLSASLFGMGLKLSHVEIGFVQNAMMAATIRGRVNIPFFDVEADVEISVDLGGGFSVRLSNPGGLAKLVKPGLLELNLESLGLENRGGVGVFRLSGTVRPLFGAPALDWPAITIKELTIDSQGSVHLDGGWLDLPDHYALDFHGFGMEITRLGFGKDQGGGHWVGFSGGLKLVEGLTAGASVDGLRITWHDSGAPSISLDGVGVEFAIPGVLHFQGAVSYREIQSGADTIHRFDGKIKLVLDALQLEIDGEVVVGTDSGPGGSFTFFAIYLDLELPAGIPLWTTGLGLYGIAGLFAMEMAPNKKPDEGWYEDPDGSPGWYKRPTEGVIDLKSKWDPSRGAFAFGAGLTLGTEPDNGFTVNGKVLLVISLPGPIILLEGRANLLRTRASLDDDPMFRALAVLDGKAGSFLIALDAYYKYFGSGELIDIHGGAEAFFSFSQPELWHVYLGRDEPRDRRIRASIFFHMFEANAYFMLDASSLKFGAWVGYDRHWDFGPLSVTLESWIEGHAAVSWKPPHVHADFGLHGKAGLAVFGFGFSLGFDVFAALDVFEPFHILAGVHVGISLPWPLPDFDATVTLEWPQEGGDKSHPPLPVPLQEVAIEHFKVTTNWPLPLGGPAPLLLPNYDRGDGFLGNPAAGDPIAPPPAGAPVVPMDCRPHITFGRAVHDDALVGINAQPVIPARERIGDPGADKGPALIRYGLTEVSLHRWDGASWVLSGRKGPTANPPGVRELFGSWAPVPAMPDGLGKFVAQTKLWLWSKTPFDYTMHTGGSWDEWFTGRFKDYPCVRVPDPREECCDFRTVASGTVVASPWHCPDDPRMTISWDGPTTLLGSTITTRLGVAQALCQRDDSARNLRLVVTPPEPTSLVVISLVNYGGATAIGFDADGNPSGPFVVAQGDNALVVGGSRLVQVVVTLSSMFCIYRICARLGPDQRAIDELEKLLKHLRDSLAVWSQVGEVMAPHTSYRLSLVTTIDAKGEGDLAGYAEHHDLTQFAYFRTEGPPGLAQLSRPIGLKNDGVFHSGLDDLAAYVRQTVPASVRGPGEPPPLPRPVYRAYDVGVAFNEDYVDLLYRLDRRDLGVTLFDANNRPVRDAQGRLIIVSNRWGHADSLTLSESETLWINTINGNDCAQLNLPGIPKDVTLGAPPQVLEADFLHEARLIPLLLHEDFAKGRGAWTVLDEGANASPSAWTTGVGGAPPSPYVSQASSIWGGSTDGSDPVKPGTMLLLGANPALDPTHPDQPANWTDYRFSTFARPSAGNGVGLVFRYQAPGYFYRFSMDHTRRYRRLVRVVGGAHTVLAEDDEVSRPGVDVLITVEALGPSLRAFVDGTPVFDVTDPTFAHGGIGLYSWQEPGVKFSDVRVDDLRTGAPVPYRFRFTTSKFADFFHHLHSFQDETFRAAPPAGDSWTTAASSPGAVETDSEQRAYEEVAATALGTSAHQLPKELQVARLEAGGLARGFLIRGPEPIDWSRTTLSLEHAGRLVGPVGTPQIVKIAEANFGTVMADDESVLLVLRDSTDVSGLAIDYLRPPGPVAAPGADTILFADSFGNGDGVLFREAFGPNALDHYEIVDEGTSNRPSAWAISGGRIVQTSSIYGGSLAPSDPDKPGTTAVTGSSSWTDYRLICALDLAFEGEVGLSFRYIDANNYYRFSVGRVFVLRPGFLSRDYRRLVKKVRGAITVLWEDMDSRPLGNLALAEIFVSGDQIVGSIDDEVLFAVTDPDLGSGRVGLYAWRAANARFEAIVVEAIGAPLVLWDPPLADLGELVVRDEAGVLGRPSNWSASAGAVIETAAVHDDDGNAPRKAGTLVIGGRPGWEDVQISVRLRYALPGAVGVVFRYRDGDNFYRFSMGRTPAIPIILNQPYRRLVKVVGGVVTVLWQDNVWGTAGQDYELTLRAVGNDLSGAIDGGAIFDVRDASLNAGRVGLYSWDTPEARFERLLVIDRTRRVGAWAVHDEGTTAAPSTWRILPGNLVQSSAITGGAPPASPGTYVVAGERSWTDYRLTVALRSDDAGSIGLIFRHADDNNYYRLSFDSTVGQRLLIKKEAGVVGVLWQDATVPAVGVNMKLTIDVVGSRLVGYLDRVRLFDVRDPAIGSGCVGLYCRGNTAARFRRVEVRRPALLAFALLRDRFFSGDLGGWTVVDEGNQNLPSDWKAAGGILRQTRDIFTSPTNFLAEKRGTEVLAGDPGWTDSIVQARVRPEDGAGIGLLFRYADDQNFYRLSLEPNRTFRIPPAPPGFSVRRTLRLVKKVAGVYTIVWNGLFEYHESQVYELTVVADGPDLKAFIDGVPAFTVRDGDLPRGRVGLYHWHGTDGWFSDVRVYPIAMESQGGLLDDRFHALVLGRWQFVDQGDLDTPSHWEVNDAGLRQTAKIAGGDPAPAVPEKPGTVAITGDTTWSDYRFVVGLETSSPGAIGVVVRYLDEQNYYRLTLSESDEYRRFVKVSAGVVTILWQDAGPFVDDRPVLLTLDCLGSHIVGSQDGQRLFAIDDEAMTSGRVGLYSWANPDALFLSAMVHPPGRAIFYRFGQEPLLPAGAKIRVYSGSLDEAPVVEPNVVRRFAAEADDAGSLRFPKDGVDLRLIDRNSIVQHSRTILPPSSYAAAAFRVLRKTDGTGFVIIPDAAPGFDAGEYRLSLTYRRDNTASDPKSPIFSESGDKNPEEVVLDLPWKAHPG